MSGEDSVPSSSVMPSLNHGNVPAHFRAIKTFRKVHQGDRMVTQMMSRHGSQPHASFPGRISWVRFFDTDGVVELLHYLSLVVSSDSVLRSVRAQKRLVLLRSPGRASDLTPLDVEGIFHFRLGLGVLFFHLRRAAVSWPGCLGTCPRL